MRLFLFAALCLSPVSCLTSAAYAATCKVAQPHASSPAELAFLRGDYEQAVTLYRQQLSKSAAASPDNPQLTADLVRVLLRQQKTAEGEAAATSGLAAHPHSAPLETALAEVQYRQGLPWKAGPTVSQAVADDPCYARGHLLLSQVFRLSSMYAYERQELETAYKLDPIDPDVHGAWIGTLPVTERILAMRKYLAAETGDDAETRKDEQAYLEHLEKRRDEPHKACRLVSSSDSTEIPFIFLLYDSSRIRAFGLDVKLNNKDSRLEIDTGASGIYVSRSVAQRAGLKQLYRDASSGIGDQGEQTGYTAYADSIHIGSLEFRDCIVQVSDRRNVVDSDGLIGMNVFSQFLVGLDYPMRKLTLAALPKRPEDTTSDTPTLRTDDATESDATTPVAAAAATASGKDGNSSAAKSPAASSISAPRNRYVAPKMKSYTPVYRVGHELLLPTSLNGSSVKLFLLDTGAWATSISPEAARTVTKVHNDYFTEVKGISGKVKKVYSADKITLQFANLRQEVDDVYSFDTANLSRHSGMDIAGFLGFSTLRLLTIQIDYRDGLVKFDYDSNRGSNRYR